MGDIKTKLVKELQEKAKQLRIEIIKMIAKAGSGHPGGSLSSIDMILALYKHKLKFDPKRPMWPDRDCFVFSKGHACPALYAVLADLGFFPKKELGHFRQINSLLQGHTSTKIPGIEMSGGSLGQGLSFANGIAMASRIDKRDCRVWVMLGDGEMQEGQIWEAAMTTSYHKLHNVMAILDRNRIQNDDFVAKTMEINPIKEKWESFGWEVHEIDGHNFSEILDALDWAEKKGNKPKIIIAHTIKGKGVSFMENNPSFHGKAPNEEELKQALKELGE